MSTIRPSRASPARAPIAAAALASCAALALASAGCRTFSQEPVSKNVAQGRELTQQGVNAMDRGDWNRAESMLERAVATSPKDAQARRNYAEALWHRGAHAQALEHFEKACELAPADAGLLVRSGEFYLALGQRDRALARVDEALKLDPRCAAAWALRGRVAGAAGQHRQALADYQRSLGYAPDNLDVAILVAESYRQLNEPDRALVTLQAVADRYSTGDEPQRVLHLEGLALMALRRYDDAARQLARAAGRERPTADLLCHLADAELHAGHPQQAQQALQHALALDPQHAPSRALSSRLALAPTNAVR